MIDTIELLFENAITSQNGSFQYGSGVAREKDLCFGGELVSSENGFECLPSSHKRQNAFDSERSIVSLVIHQFRKEADHLFRDQWWKECNGSCQHMDVGYARSENPALSAHHLDSGSKVMEVGRKFFQQSVHRSDVIKLQCVCALRSYPKSFSVFLLPEGLFNQVL